MFDPPRGVSVHERGTLHRLRDRRHLPVDHRRPYWQEQAEDDRDELDREADRVVYATEPVTAGEERTEGTPTIPTDTVEPTPSLSTRTSPPGGSREPSTPPV